MRVLKKGMVGDDVKVLQQFLGIAVDGAFGTQTENAVKKWQAENGLVADGVVGMKTWTKIADFKAVAAGVIYDPLKIHITKSSNRPIKYIAIHYTAGGSSKPGSALKVKNVFESRKASADFAVDDEKMVQFNPDLKNYYCWAVGDQKNMFSKGGSLYGKVTNKNTISIEICSNLKYGTSASVPNHEGWYFTGEALRNAAELCKILMEKYNISFENVVRHYDISGKMCPGIIGWNDENIYTTTGKQTKEKSTSKEWEYFKKMLK